MTEHAPVHMQTMATRSEGNISLLPWKGKGQYQYIPEGRKSRCESSHGFLKVGTSFYTYLSMSALTVYLHSLRQHVHPSLLIFTHTHSQSFMFGLPRFSALNFKKMHSCTFQKDTAMFLVILYECTINLF